MEIGSLFLILAVAILAGLYVVQPFRRMQRTPSRVRSNTEEHEISALLAERDRIIQALQELDFDYVLNKIPADDYPQQRVELLRRGAEVLRRLDSLLGASSGIALGGSAEERLEAAAAARRADAAVASGQLALQDNDEIEALIAARRKVRKKKSAGFCPNCGKPVLASDRFCASCGTPIQ